MEKNREYREKWKGPRTHNYVFILDFVDVPSYHGEDFKKHFIIMFLITSYQY